MAELTPQERLYPSLLDRLTDNEPHKSQESREARVFSIRRLREAVLRDLSWLLNTCHLQTSQDLSGYPNVQKSVLNYGIPELTAKTASGLQLIDIQRAIRQAICDFEPRVLPHSLEVRAVVAEEEMSHNALTFEIEAELWSRPLPERLFLKTEIDLDTGHISVTDQF